jgi:septal ring factor EnvC (AmiA/AmiB activator)
MRPLPLVVVLWVCVVALSAVAGDRDRVVKDRSELEQVKREVDQGRKRLDSLKAEELRLQKASVGYDQRASSERTLLSRLGDQLSQLRQNIARAEEEQDARQLQLEQARVRYLDNIRQFYCLTKSPNYLSFSDPNAELQSERQLVYLTAVTGYQQGTITATNEQLSRAREELETMTGKTAELEALKRRRETNVAVQRSRQEKAEKELARVRRLSRQQSDRLISLEQSAREMERIISRLEEEKKKAARRPKNISGPSAFAMQEGNLPQPYKGEIIQSFGASVDPVTHLRSYSPGITIKGKSGAPVICVAAGTVAYAGELRGYGTFVIISHEDQYYTTYAGLTDLAVGQGDRVSAGARLGAADPTGLVRFELRKGQDEVDPVKWLK